jgi:integrase
MTPDLFADHDPVSPTEYREALADWLSDESKAGRLQRASSIDVYTHMWTSLTEWAVGQGVRLAEISAQDLSRCLDARGGAQDLSARYAWRMLRLVDRVLAHRARRAGHAPNRAAAQLLEERPDLRFANAADQDPLPDFLSATQAKDLVTYLSAVRPRRTMAGQPWQEVRNRAAVGVMLGAGVTPGEVRSLTIADVHTDGGRSKGVPWKLRIAGNGNSPARETPIAPWAGQLLRFWLEVRTEQQVPGVMLFPSTRGTGKPWGKVAQYNAAKAVLQAAGIDDPDGGSFRLRHTFALRQLRRGTSEQDVARWLGVTDPSVMARYQRVLSSPMDVV